MALASPWLSLSDLSNIYGISAIHCERALQQNGWRDRHGRPTPGAIEAGAATTTGFRQNSRTALWNAEVCKQYLEKTGYKPISKNVQIEQWTKLLEALYEGSPSINATAEQMAKDLPVELISAVNAQLAIRGCKFRVLTSTKTCNCKASISQ